MGLFDFIADAGDKLFGGGDIDEAKVREHLTSLGLALGPFSVVAHQKEKMVSLIGFARTMDDKEKAIVAAGNIKGVEKVDDRLKIGQPSAPAAAPIDPGALPTGGAAVDEGAGAELEAHEQPSSRFHTVASGDTLSAIAKRYYDNAGRYPEIFEANKPMLADPDRIYPGQVLRIP